MSEDVSEASRRQPATLAVAEATPAVAEVTPAVAEAFRRRPATSDMSEAFRR